MVVEAVDHRTIGTQTDMEPQNARVTRPKPKYEHTEVKEGNPLSLDCQWDLVVMRNKEDKEIELGIQRLFRLVCRDSSSGRRGPELLSGRTYQDSDMDDGKGR